MQHQLSVYGRVPTAVCLVLQTMPHDKFVQMYEKPRIPVVITGLQAGWKAQEDWNTHDLEQRFANHNFKVHSPTKQQCQCSNSGHLLTVQHDLVQRFATPVY